MPLKISSKNTYNGILFAVLATIIWSGNFIVARGVIKDIPPISLAFYRWLMGTIIITPFALKQFKKEKAIVVANWKSIFWISLFGITIYNTLIYTAAKSLPAIDLALIGTTSSPVMSIVLAAVFLKETIKPIRIAGLLLCISGILLLLSQGSWQKLIQFHFSNGDWWILLAALSFAIYNILVRKKPPGISPISFIFITFLLGTILLFPAFIIETNTASLPPITWSNSLLLIVLYLGLGNSVLSFLCWNEAIARLGAGRTALFGNLIPIFSSIEAVIFLNEKVTSIHFISGILVISGLIIANVRKKGGS